MMFAHLSQRSGKYSKWHDTSIVCPDRLVSDCLATHTASGAMMRLQGTPIAIGREVWLYILAVA